MFEIKNDIRDRIIIRLLVWKCFTKVSKRNIRNLINRIDITVINIRVLIRPMEKKETHRLH